MAGCRVFHQQRGVCHCSRRDHVARASLVHEDIRRFFCTPPFGLAHYLKPTWPSDWPRPRGQAASETYRGSSQAPALYPACYTLMEATLGHHRRPRRVRRRPSWLPKVAEGGFNNPIAGRIKRGCLGRASKGFGSRPARWPRGQGPGQVGFN